MANSVFKDRFGPTALVTGASDGIGRAFAEALAAQGFDLILAARREKELHRIAEQLSQTHNIKTRFLAVDLSTPEGISHLLSETVQESVGLLVAAAGFGSIGPFLEQSVESEVNMVALNCSAVVELSHGFGNRMTAARKGGIILFGSLVGFQGAPGSATYAATKSFVQSFAEGLAAELQPLGVSVLSVAPGPIASGFAARAGMQMSMSEGPDVVAQGALNALGKRTTVRPGWLSKSLGWSLAMVPRWGRVMIMGQIMKGMRGKPKEA
jgi:uncharacterized protein